MSRNFPSKEATRKLKTTSGSAGEITTSPITVLANEYGVVWKLWVDTDAANEADLKNLAGRYQAKITIGSTIWAVWLHGYLQHTLNVEAYLNPGPHSFDFGVDGLYSGVLGDNITVTVGDAGDGIITTVNYIYSGD